MPPALLKAFHCEALAKDSNLFAKLHLRKAAAALVALRVAHNPERAGPNGWMAAALRWGTSVGWNTWRALHYMVTASSRSTKKDMHPFAPLDTQILTEN